MTKIYINPERLGKYEKQEGYYSYRSLINYYCENKVLCNNLRESERFSEEFVEELYNMLDKYISEEDLKEYENDTLAYYEGIDVFQYFITDMNDYEVECLRELNNEIIVYSSELDCYVLCVTHWGTSWDYVLTNVKIESEEK